MTWGNYFSAGLVNPSFDTGDLSGWTESGADYLAISGSFGAIPASRTTNGSSYGLVNNGGGNSNSHIYQDMELTQHLSASEIDLGRLRAQGGVDLVQGESGYDQAKCVFTVLNGSSVEIATIYDSGWYQNTAWDTKNFVDYVIPSGGRYIRVKIYLWEDTFEVGSADNATLDVAIFTPAGGGGLSIPVAIHHLRQQGI